MWRGVKGKEHDAHHHDLTLHCAALHVGVSLCTGPYEAFSPALPCPTRCHHICNDYPSVSKALKHGIVSNCDSRCTCRRKDFLVCFFTCFFFSRSILHPCFHFSLPPTASPPGRPCWFHEIHPLNAMQPVGEGRGWLLLLLSSASIHCLDFISHLLSLSPPCTPRPYSLPS